MMAHEWKAVVIAHRREYENREQLGDTAKDAKYLQER